MERYIVQEKLGDGTFGTVFRAIRRVDMKVVAIKGMKRRFTTWEDILKLREFRSLYEMSSYQHHNIVQLQEVIREATDHLFFVFEYMPDGNLYEFIRRHTPPKHFLKESIQSNPVLTETFIQSIMTQILEGLDFLHFRGYFHRDIKPENILMRGNICKLADFGLARECSCKEPVTDYVSTRWYRAPEVLLRSPDYGKPVDIFGLGCILAELYSKNPLFPGENEIDQVHLITQALGTPESNWKQGVKLAKKLGISLKCNRQISLQDKVSNAPYDAIALLKDLLEWNPKDRPTCQQALKHRYFIPKFISKPSPFILTTIDRKRSFHKASSHGLVDEIPAKVCRIDDNSPRSIYDIWDNAFSIPAQSFCNNV